jgi:hypothetical protein
MDGKREGERRREKVSRIYNCEEAKFCAAGEQRVLLGSKTPKDVFAAISKGCRAKLWIKNDVILKCPKSVAIPGARAERVFKTQDLFSVGQINAAVLHQQGVKGSGVRVAVLDTGVDAQHPEVSSRIAERASFIEGSDGTDGHGHGTHVAGIIAGRGLSTIPDENGDNRILGVSPEVSLLIGKVCSDEGWCPEGSILAGIEWAVSKGAKVINLSLGGGAFLSHCDSDPLAAKANWAASQGTLVIAAAGNGAEITPGVSTPGCASRAVAVGAVDRSDVRQPWSGNGSALDLVAPGLGILSSLPCAVSGHCPEAGYGWWSGTSMATPHVTGVAALIRGANSSLLPDDVRTILTQTAYDLGGAGRDDSYGFGRVDAASAVRSARDRDSDGSLIPDDCNDSDASVSPLLPEKCGNGKDDDCDGQIDEGCAPPAPPSSSSSASSASSVSSPSSSSSSSTSRSASSSIGSSVSSSLSSEGEERNEEEEEDEDEDDDEEEDEDEDEEEKDENEKRKRVCPWWAERLPWPVNWCRKREKELPTPPNRPIETPPGQTRNRNARD